MSCWHGCPSGARCKWCAYGPTDATATSSSLACSHHLTPWVKKGCHPSHGYKIHMGLTFLVPAYPGCPGKEAVKWVSVCLSVQDLAATVTLIVCHFVSVFPNKPGLTGFSLLFFLQLFPRRTFWYMLHVLFVGRDAHPIIQPAVPEHWTELKAHQRRLSFYVQGAA